MSVYELSKHLPSCRIDRATLLNLEEYIIKQASEAFGLTEDQAQSKYSLTITEKFGKEELASMKHFGTDRFPDLTTSITLEIREWNPSVRLSVAFHREGNSKVDVVTGGNQGREKAIGFFNGVLRLLESKRSFAWFFHPNTMIGGIVFGVTLNCIGWFAALVVLKGLNLATGLLAAILIVLMIYHTGTILKPYTAFESRRTEIMERTWNWLASSLASFLLFGTVLSMFRKKIFGF